MCDACAVQLAEAEEESAFVFSVLEREMDALVPTQRLWSKINDSIEVERKSTPLWKKTWAGITASLLSPSLAVAAAILVVLGLFSLMFVEMNKQSTGPVATVDPAPATAPTVVDPAKPITTDVASLTNGQTSAKQARSTSNTPIVKYEPAVYHTTDAASPKPSPTQPVSIPGEDSYVKTIASLSQTVDNQKDTVLKPSEIVSYERDMAVVDDAIKKMRAEVRKNPKNESAKQVLYTSYQNKIDLLNSVSQREELVASLK
jgi:hypothetical protein